jgi:hypothetical protein
MKRAERSGGAASSSTLSMPRQGDHVVNDVGGIARHAAKEILKRSDGMPAPISRRLKTMASDLEASAAGFDQSRAAAGTAHAPRRAVPLGDPAVAAAMYRDRTPGDANSARFGETKGRLMRSVDQILQSARPLGGLPSAVGASNLTAAYTVMGREIDRIDQSAFDPSALHRVQAELHPSLRAAHASAVDTALTQAAELLKAARDAAGEAAHLLSGEGQPRGS